MALISPPLASMVCGVSLPPPQAARLVSRTSAAAAGWMLRRCAALDRISGSWGFSLEGVGGCHGLIRPRDTPLGHARADTPADAAFESSRMVKETGVYGGKQWSRFCSEFFAIACPGLLLPAGCYVCPQF